MCPCSRIVAALFLALVLLLSNQPNVAAIADSAVTADPYSAGSLLASVDDQETQTRLENGEVVVDLVEDGETKFVVGKILIDQPPAVVWPILVNPFEFAGKICPRMKKCDVLQDEPNISVLQCSIYVCFMFPTISYTVESKYDPVNMVEFKRIGGCLRDFRGCWILRPQKEGARTEVLYSMFVDPGIPLPKWIVREGVKNELPHTLTGLRQRVDQIASKKVVAEGQTIAASRLAPAKIAQKTK